MLIGSGNNITSHSYESAWIEIIRTVRSATLNTGRTLTRVRGLKSDGVDVTIEEYESHSYESAWIEIDICIEDIVVNRSRTLTRVRGLKFTNRRISNRSSAVALLRECVD